MTPPEPTGEALTPAVVQDAVTGRLLMVAYMDPEAERLTRETGLVHFWSRSRGRLWKKGETSGHTLRLVECKRDCDGDALWIRAVPAGPTCHTGSQSCFGADGVEPLPDELHALWQTILARRGLPLGSRSYVRALLADPRVVTDKIAEESAELAVELLRQPPDRRRVVAEAADVLFHLLVGLASAEVGFDEVLTELHRRAGTSGLDEKAARK
jgi:phosphoribosyl-ATP pyrophosphohydrolase/phosphoribosyl-AMP cyclohydrolase